MKGNSVSVLINCPSRYKIDRRFVRAELKRSLYRHGLRRPVEVSLTFVGDRKMRDLNCTYRQLDQPTSILTFSLLQGEEAFYYPPAEKVYLGDIVISYPQLIKRASRREVMVNTELADLLDHGVKNLLDVGMTRGD
jgi:probable rRNA maturation factor